MNHIFPNDIYKLCDSQFYTPKIIFLAYIGFLVGLLGLVAESRVMIVLVGTELREQPRRPL